MKEHLDQTLTEAVDELTGNFAASVTDYEAIHLHILAMADTLSSGIMRQFPASSADAHSADAHSADAHFADAQRRRRLINE